jgi:hypothetical protein
MAINAKLKPPSGVVITASELPLEIQPGDRRVPVNPSALLTRLSWTGSPSFPDIFGHFSASGAESRRRVRLHTAALKEISHRLNLHHAWGVEPSNDISGTRRQRRARPARRTPGVLTRPASPDSLPDGRRRQRWLATGLSTSGMHPHSPRASH